MTHYSNNENMTRIYFNGFSRKINFMKVFWGFTVKKFVNTWWWENLSFIFNQLNLFKFGSFYLCLFSSCKRNRRQLFCKSFSELGYHADQAEPKKGWIIALHSSLQSSLEYLLSRTCSLVALLTLGNCLYKFVRYLEPCYPECSICWTFLPPSNVSSAVFYPLSRTFSFRLFKCWKNTFEKFDRLFIFSYFNTTTCRSSESITSKVLCKKCQSLKDLESGLSNKKLLKNLVYLKKPEAATQRCS